VLEVTSSRGCEDYCEGEAFEVLVDSLCEAQVRRDGQAATLLRSSLASRGSWSHDARITLERILRGRDQRLELGAQRPRAR